jgi:LmbE family N-acetylglucosaminyl deacetylase
VESSYVVILDQSRSMDLEESGRSRFDLIRSSLISLWKNRWNATEWALYGFSQTDEIVLHHPFTEDTADLVALAENLHTEGLSPVKTAIATALDYLAKRARGETRGIILASDGLATDGAMFGWVLPPSFAESGVKLFVLGVSHHNNPAALESNVGSARSTGGDFFRYDGVETLREALISQSSSGQNKLLNPGGEGEADPGQQSRERRDRVAYERAGVIREPPDGLQVLLYSGLILLLSAFPLHLRERRWGKRRKRMLANPRFTMSFTIRFPDGRSEAHEDHRGLLTIGNAEECDVRLLSGRRRRSPFVLQMSRYGRATSVQGNQPFFVNGVETRKRRLREGDRIAWGGYRLFFNGTRADVPPLPAIPLLSPPLLAAGFSLFFLFTPLNLFWPSRFPAQTGIAGYEEAETGTARFGNPTGDFSATGSREAPVIALVREPPDLPLPRSPLVVVTPAEGPTFFKADILFVHAHPDDESLDFGGLMAKAARGGKRVVSLLLTDGESGLDQYPRRSVGGFYPAGRLTGEGLARVRVQEARGALSLLGAELYLRWGLRNHPYSGLTDEISLEQIFLDWGGREQLVERLAALIKGFRPELVVSPDFSWEIHEHFEHKAAGFLTLRALQYLQGEGMRFVKGYLVSTDPLKEMRFETTQRVDLMQRDPLTGLTYREIQAAALAEHRSQTASSVLGVEWLPNFRWEEYGPLYWVLGGSLEDYLAGTIELAPLEEDR